jgi:YHS domain-containing protein
MHGTMQAIPGSSASEKQMVIDPVCRMTIDPATAVACEKYGGTLLYFCSKNCRDRFLENPNPYVVAHARSGISTHQCCLVTDGQGWQGWNWPVLAVPVGTGVLASATLLSVYFGVLSLLSGRSFAVEQFNEWWPYIVALVIGFGVQVGLFVYLRRAVHRAASGKVLVATGTTSGAAMLACCTHYLVNLLPVLGATGLMSFVGAYQVELFWFGIASNLAGIAYIGRRVVSFASGA